MVDPISKAALMTLHEQARAVDLLDLAGAVVASPLRKLPSQAGILAMAMAVEGMWEVCLEAEQLALAVEQGLPQPDAERWSDIALKAGRVRGLMLVLTGRTEPIHEETTHGEG